MDIEIKSKRKYTKKNKEVLNEVPNDVSVDAPIKIKRKYTKKNKEVPNEVPNEVSVDVPIKIKRKYTKKNKEVSNEVSTEVPNEVSNEVPNELLIKIKRKYTKKNKDASNEVPNEVSVDVPIKIKRKYTKKNKDASNEVPNEVSVDLPIKIKRKYTKKNKAENIKKKIIITENEININPNIKPMPRWNEKFVDVLEQLEKIMQRNGEPFKAKAYSNAKETILSITEDITDIKQLEGKKGMGKTILEKLEKYMTEGKLDIIERERDNPLNIFSEIYGVGPKKAKELIAKYNITTLDQLRERQDELLNDKQKIGLKYYEDIQKRIPRDEIEKYKEKFAQIFDTIPKDENAKFEIVGSYRRGAKDSGDIDVIITGNTNDVYKKFIQELFAQKILIESLSSGNTKSLTVSRLSPSLPARRIDFLYSTLEEFPFSILYFTGSKGFNTVMRAKALEMGYSMNEHRITKKTTGEPIPAAFTDEKSIFAFLRLEYKRPEERIDGRFVNSISVSNEPVDQSYIQAPIITELPEKIKKIQKKKIIIENKDDGSQSKQADTIITETKNKEKKEKPKKKIVIIQNDELIHPPSQEIETKINIEQFIKDFREKGVSLLNKMSQKELEMALSELNVLYRNDTPIATDNEYDIIEDYIKEKYPNNEVVQQIGAPVEKNKVKLPYEMWSMDKIKPDSNALANWKTTYKGPYVISCKLDGVSGMFINNEDGTSKLYTRGDGKVGQDITNLIPYLKLPKKKGIVIRGEFIMDKEVFTTKYAANFANARNLVSGIINRQTVDDKIRDIRFVAYEVISPVLKPSQQMELLQTLNIDIVQYSIMTDVTNESLSKILQDWRTSSKYQIDGIIVANDAIYPRVSGNPKHSFAFKMVLSDQMAEAKVVDVIWTASKDGYLKPRVKIEPIQLGGVRVEYATGFNASFIEKNKIGVGALIEIIRSGDVIPYINKVIEPAVEAKMPTEEYEWNSTRVDVIIKDKSTNETVTIKNIAGFFKGLGVDGLGEGNVARIVKAGFNTIPKVIKMIPEDFAKVEGFQSKMVIKISNGIKDKLHKAPLSEIMAHSNLLGRGFSTTKIDAILTTYPDVLTSTDETNLKIMKISNIKGFSDITAKTFVGNIPEFLSFLNESGLEYKLIGDTAIDQTKQFDTNDILYKKSIIMTGFRDKVIEEKIKEKGGIIANSIRKDLFVVLTKDKMELTGKLLKAKSMNLPIMTPDEFQEKYL